MEKVKVDAMLVVNGEEKYKETLNRVSEQLERQWTELWKLEERYRENANGLEYLNKKGQILAKEQTIQKQVLKELQDELDNAGKSVKKYADQENDLKGKLKAVKKERSELRKTTKDSTEDQRKLTEQIGQYKKELKECRDNQKRAQASVEEWREKVELAKTSLKDIELSLNENDKYLKEAKKSTDKCAVSINKYGEAVENAGKSSKGKTATIEALAKAIQDSGLKSGLENIQKALLQCVDTSAQFETGMAKISTIADTEGMSLEEVKESIVKLSNESGKSVTDLSEAVYNVMTANLDAAQAVELTGNAVKLAAGGFTDEKVAIDMLATVMDAYKMEVSETSKVSDYLITVQSLGKTTVGELIASIQDVIPVAAACDVEMDNLSTAYTVMTSNGITTAEAGNSLKAMLGELGDSGSGVSKVLREETGMSFEELLKRGDSLGDVMGILGQAVNNDAGSFSKLWSSSEAVKGALSLLKTGTEQYNDVLRQVQESTGATEEACGKMADTTEMAQKRMTNSFENLKIAVGDQLRPQMERLYETGGDIVDWAEEFVNEHELLIPVIEAITLAIMAYTGAAGIYGAVTEVLIPLIKTFNATVSANAVVTAVAAVSALALALLPLVKGESEATKANREYMESIQELTDTVDANIASYEEKREAISSNGAENKRMAERLTELLEKESKSAAEKESILILTDKLNKAIPELGLNYDSVSESVNMSTEELIKMTEAHEQMEQYRNSAEAWSDLYLEQMKMSEELAEAERNLADAKEEQNNVEVNYKEVQDRIETYQGAIEDLNTKMEENAAEMAAMRDETNLYTIQSAELLPACQQQIDMMLAEAETVKEDKEAYSERLEVIAATVQGYQDYADSMKSHVGAVMEEMQGLQEAYQESYQAAYENIQQQIGLFEEMKVESAGSIGDLIGNMQSQVNYMEQYAENIRLAMEYGVDQGIIEKLSDGSRESAAYLAAIVEDGGENVDKLNKEFRRVEEGKTVFSETVAEMETDYSKKMDELVAETERAVSEMAMHDESFASAVDTCRGLVEGVDFMWDEVVGRHVQLARAAMKAYNNEMLIKSPSQKFKWSAEMEMEGIKLGIEENESGIYDKYRRLASGSVQAYAEEAETVKQAVSEAGLRMLMSIPLEQDVRPAGIYENTEQYLEQILGLLRAGGKGTGKGPADVQTINIYQPVKSPVEMARELRRIGRELAF